MSLEVITDNSDFTPAEAITNLREGDTSFQLFGYVEKIQKLRDNGKTKSFQFTVNNGFDSTVQIVCFNDLAEKFVKLVNQSGLVVSVDKVRPKPPKNAIYLRTTCRLELHVHKNTVITIEGIYKPNIENATNSKTDYEELQFIRQSVGKTIGVTAFIKTEFRVVELDTGKFLSAAVTDNYYKLQVTAQCGGHETFLKSSFNEKGRKIYLTGTLTVGQSDLLRLNIKSIEDINGFDEIALPLETTIEGFHLIP